MNMREYEVVKGFDENQKDYPEYIKTIIEDLNDYVNTLGTRIVELDNIMDTLDNEDNKTAKFVVNAFIKELSDNIDDTDLCITTVDINSKGINPAIQWELLNLLGFINVETRFSSANKKIMLYIRNNAGYEYWNALRYIVFTFLDNCGKIGIEESD
ncbi:MAG: hypothetical protein IKR19_07640 [Acholeplasmatales bacterium]|nr:hypothetical protein [Acholeplasmatales bacterium]